MFIIFLKNFYTPSPCGDFPYIRGRIWDRFLGTVCSPVRERVVPLPGNSSFPYRGTPRSLTGERPVPKPSVSLLDLRAVFVSAPVAYGQDIVQACAPRVL